MHAQAHLFPFVVHRRFPLILLFCFPRPKLQRNVRFSIFIPLKIRFKHAIFAQTEETDETENDVTKKADLLLPSGGLCPAEIFSAGIRTPFCTGIYPPENQQTLRLSGIPPLGKTTSSSVFSVSYDYFAANAVILLIKAASCMLKRQIDSKMQDFELNGGFSGYLHKIRAKHINNPES